MFMADKKEVLTYLLMVLLGLGLFWLSGYAISEFFAMTPITTITRLVILFLVSGLSVITIRGFFKDSKKKLLEKETIAQVAFIALLLIVLQFIPNSTPVSMMIVKP